MQGIKQKSISDEKLSKMNLCPVFWYIPSQNLPYFDMTLDIDIEYKLSVPFLVVSMIRM